MAGPRLYDLIMGVNQWIYRVIAYVALMTDDHPRSTSTRAGPNPQPNSPPPTVDR